MSRFLEVVNICSHICEFFQKEMSPPDVKASRRLLITAVRDAVAESALLATKKDALRRTESAKRLQSVVSTDAGMLSRALSCTILFTYVEANEFSKVVAPVFLFSYASYFCQSGDVCYIGDVARGLGSLLQLNGKYQSGHNSYVSI